MKQIKIETRFGLIRVRCDTKTGATTYFLKGGHQSAVDGDGISLDMYIHAIYGLTLQTKAKDVLMIGCGGGTLGNMLARAGKRVTIVDIDKNAFRIAKKHFHLSSEVHCHVADGLVYMNRVRRRYDVVVADAFVGEKIPQHLMGEAFFKAVRKCVKRRGALFVNVCLSTRKDRTADRMAQGLKDHGWPVRMLDRVRVPARNAIILAGAVRKLKHPKMVIRPKVDGYKVDRELKAMRFRPIDAGKQKARSA